MKKCFILLFIFIPFICQSQQVSKEYVDYLKYYENVKECCDAPRSITFERLFGKVYWVTWDYDTGSGERIYWENRSNLLVPIFRVDEVRAPFEKGWGIRYTFTHLPSGRKQSDLKYGIENTNDFFLKFVRSCLSNKKKK